MPAYVNSIHCISPYQAAGATHAGAFIAPDPVYTEVLSPSELRRTPRLVKMGLYAAARCLADAGLDSVDAIVVGSGLGSFDGFEKFENALLEQAEETLAPTSFIQSLDNAVAGQLALKLECYGYNMTYTHRGFSFETALLDGLLLLAETDGPTNVLVGGLDETTPTYAQLLQRGGHLKSPAEAGRVELSHSPGVQPGEGATFLVLSSVRQPSTLAAVRAVRTVFSPRTALEVEHALTALLHEQHLAPGDLDLVLLGNGGDNAQDQKLRTVEASLPGIPREYFKNYCGEYHTAAAFAVWLGVQRLSSSGAAPGACAPKTCLIINQYRDVNYSIILLTRD
ncbi:beta-ketoacyl synthase chain length factor [Hymenobacter negativus]|uniref:Beta-ketoacyl synthase chain length factor n=1 Tax=Hymenobacter negativus TaxID=2795026 RepID=A0ABS3QP80_9BACT|nr:beta-ketoacyl synthase N-terminal-like domain-containing protein [Hymenobacter negativus]MBO2013085.1 beta-ketoacyl synthase chain length factor [Hymenobacter negativus]